MPDASPARIPWRNRRTATRLSFSGCLATTGPECPCGSSRTERGGGAWDLLCGTSSLGAASRFMSGLLINAFMSGRLSHCAYRRALVRPLVGNADSLVLRVSEKVVNSFLELRTRNRPSVPECARGAPKSSLFCYRVIDQWSDVHPFARPELCRRR